MKISEAIKNFILADLAIGIVITAMLWTSLGAEGMAAKFCSLINVERCNEIEWSDDLNPNQQD